jgi:hypothetical protein
MNTSAANHTKKRGKFKFLAVTAEASRVLVVTPSKAIKNQ